MSNFPKTTPPYVLFFEPELDKHRLPPPWMSRPVWTYHVNELNSSYGRSFLSRGECLRAAWHEFAARVLEAHAVWQYAKMYVSDERRFVPCPALRVGRTRLALKHPSWDMYPGTYLLTTEDGPPRGFEDLTEAMLSFIGAIFQHELSFEPEQNDAPPTRE